jgi:flagellar assembly protein FliH
VSTQNVSAYNFEQLDTSGDAERAPADVLAAAWAEAEHIRQQARIDGEAAGYAAGMQRAQDEFQVVSDGLVRALGEAAQALAGTRAELVESLTRQAADVSLGVGRQIVAGAVEVKPELVMDVIRGAIRRLSERHRLTVLVNQDDLELVSNSLERLRLELGGIEFMEVLADRRIERGGTIVQTEYGEIDATIATQIENARALLAASLVGDRERDTDEHQAADDAV